MSDRLKKLFSKSSSPPVEESTTADGRPTAPRLPSFGESRYEDTTQGASPAQGLLPLRGNKAFAVLHEPLPRPQENGREYIPNHRSGTTSEMQSTSSLRLSDHLNEDSSVLEAAKTRRRTSMPNGRNQPNLNGDSLQSRKTDASADHPYGGRPVRSLDGASRPHRKDGQYRESPRDQLEPSHLPPTITTRSQLDTSRQTKDRIGSVEEQPVGGGSDQQLMSSTERRDHRGNVPASKVDVPARKSLPASSSHAKIVRFAEDAPATNHVATTDTLPAQEQVQAPISPSPPGSQSSQYSWATADEPDPVPGLESGRQREEQLLSEATATRQPTGDTSSNTAMGLVPSKVTEDDHTNTSGALLRELPLRGHPHAGQSGPLSTSSSEVRDSSSTMMSGTAALRDSQSMSSVEPPPRNSSKGKASTSADGAAGTSFSTAMSSEEVVRRAGYNSEDETVHRTVRPAVIHETITNKVHHIREEHIYREFHHYDIYHRILPIIDVEVLPERHYKVVNDKLVEMKPEEIPRGRRGTWVIAETVSTGKMPVGPRLFTAREFYGEDGDEKTYITPEGVPRTETTWIHPPQLEPGGRATEQTVPFEL